MTNSVSQNGNLDSWLPMPEVIAATGMSQRTVYRMVTEGRLRQASRPIPGRRPLPVFHPDDVAALAQSTIKPLRFVPAPMAESRQDQAAESRQELPPPEFWMALVEAVRARPAELPQAAESRQDGEAESAESVAELRQKVLVTRAEARRLGITPAILSRAVKNGKIEQLPGKRYRVKDLEAL